MNSFSKLIWTFLLLASATGFSQADSADTRNQAKLAAFLEKFPAADTDGDGTLTMVEVRAFREKMNAKKEGAEERKAKKNADKPKPTFANLKYGPQERNVIDVWLPEGAAEAESPLPMVVFFHGGGFVGGDKSGFDPRQFLDAGMAAASGNYRYVDGNETLVTASLSDAARAVQFLKSKAGAWNLDKEKFAMSGGSAGAVITMWVGYHDDMAKPDSEDPIERESTRLAALMPINGPANLNPVWIRKHMGGPHHIHGSMPKMYGPDWDTEAGHASILKTSPWELVTKDDPPTFLVYSTRLTEVPLPESATTGELVHHAHFGKMMKARLEEAGVPAKFVHSFDPRGKTDLADFLKSQFLK